jgi:hypothetical protein
MMLSWRGGLHDSPMLVSDLASARKFMGWPGTGGRERGRGRVPHSAKAAQPLPQETSSLTGVQHRLQEGLLKIPMLPDPCCSYFYFPGSPHALPLAHLNAPTLS